MPHTSHRKKQSQRNKRAEVQDESGWTRVTNTSTSQREPRAIPLPNSHIHLHDGRTGGVTEEREEEEDDSTTEHRISTSIPESTPYPGATLQKLERRYKELEKTWVTSRTWLELQDVLRNKIDGEILKEVDRCVVFGTGSFCGHIQGWIERFDTSILQLVAFVKVLECIESITGRRPLAFSQEPVYNDLDVEFLRGLEIERVNSPIGFGTLTERSLIYAPAAELDVELKALAADPAVAMVTGKLDFFWRNDRGEACTDRILVARKEKEWDEDVQPDDLVLIHELAETDDRRSRNGDRIEKGLSVLEEFKKDKDVYLLPELDFKDQPFHSLYVYARRLTEDQIITSA